MTDGAQSVFTPASPSAVGETGPDGFSAVSVPTSGIVNLRSNTPARITVFNIRVGKTCSKGGTLSVQVTYYYGSSEETVVCMTYFNISSIVLFSENRPIR